MEQPGADFTGVTSGTLQLSLYPLSRLVVLRFSGETSLTGEDGAAMIAALERVRGTEHQPFGFLVDCAGVVETDSAYRETTGTFFRQQRETARIALYNLGPIIRIVAEMFRVAFGLQLRTFTHEEAARAWLRAEGVLA
jgi:hypothetical protein